MGILVNSRVSHSASFQIPQTYLIVGLGNVGEKYHSNRHNVGFLCVDRLRDTFGFPKWTEKSRLQCEFSSGEIDGNKVILAKPTTMMNLSGSAVQAIMSFYRIEERDLLVIYDDIDLAYGVVRTRMRGRSGGHNGVASVMKHIGSDFARLRIGIANEHSDTQDTANFVLSNFSKKEQGGFEDMFTAVEEAVNQFLEGSSEETTRSFL